MSELFDAANEPYTLKEIAKREMNKTNRSAIPPRNKPQNDLVMTPDYLARRIVRHFKPCGLALDPCSGNGAFLFELLQAPNVTSASWCEISHGIDFLVGEDEKVDWIISNPPYSILTPWLKKSFEVADNVVYLIQPPAAFFTARRRVAREAGFAIKEIYYVDCPPEWKAQKLSFGAGLGAVHWQRGWTGGITETVANEKEF